MQRALLLVTPQLLIDLLKGDGTLAFEVVSGQLPADARVVDVAYINSQGAIALTLESASFPALPAGAKPPMLTAPECRVVVVDAPDQDANTDADRVE